MVCLGLGYFVVEVFWLGVVCWGEVLCVVGCFSVYLFNLPSLDFSFEELKVDLFGDVCTVSWLVILPHAAYTISSS